MRTRKFGLIGYPLSHSFSKKYFSEKFVQMGIHNSHSYDLFPLPNISKFPELITENPELVGINVTIPYKLDVISYLDHVEEEAKEIGAVNVVKVTKNGLKGYNSDVYGFEVSLLKLLDDCKTVSALILGTGGASKAVAFVLDKLDIPYLWVSRTPMGKKVISYSDVDEDMIADRRLIINTTPLGMSPNTETLPPLPYQKLDQNHFLYDLIYNPLQTAFLKEGSKHGAQTMNGIEMLYLQAERSWTIWNSKD